METLEGFNEKLTIIWVNFGTEGREREGGEIARERVREGREKGEWERVRGGGGGDGTKAHKIRHREEISDVTGRKQNNG